jgi:hypothetical protein
VRIRSPNRRPAMAALDVVLVAAVAVPVAAALYAVVRVALGDHLFALGSAVGSPFL